MTNYSNAWGPPAPQPELGPSDIHVWRVALHDASSKANAVSGLLTNDEIKRAQRFRFQQDRDRFVVVHAVLRILLGVYTPIPPEQICFQYNVHGKPYLALNQNHAMLDFNISHAHEMALLAFARGRAVGIDLEYVRSDIRHEQIAERFFAMQEIASLQSLSGSLQSAAFFNCWTRKEAFTKATGEGLSRSLSQFSMSLVPGEAARLLAIQGQPEEASKWFVQDLEPGPGYAGALVAREPVKQIYRWEYSLL